MVSRALRQCLGRSTLSVERRRLQLRTAIAAGHVRTFSAALIDTCTHTHTHPDGVGTLINQLFGLADPCVGGEGRGSRSHSLAGRVEVEKSSDIHVIEA